MASMLTCIVLWVHVYVFVSYVFCRLCFLSFAVRCTACCITSRRWYTTATRWGGTTAIRSGAFRLHPSGFLSLFSFFVMDSIFFLLCSCSVSLYASFSFVHLSFTFYVVSSIFFYFSVPFISCFCLFFSHFPCVGVIRVYTMYGGSVIAKHNGIALNSCCLPGTM